ncbi:MAG: DinB family protein [Cyclobacteriaceae bacterium]
MIQSKTEIIEALDAAFDQISQWFVDQPDSEFEKGPDGKWTSGQHLDHLLRSVVPLNIILKKPKLVIRTLFGKPNRTGRTFEKVVENYKTKLASGGKAMGQFVPKPMTVDKKSKMLSNYQQEKGRLIQRLNTWRESQLDSYLLPHPLLGKMLVREMLFFTIYHNHHHLHNLQEEYSTLSK